MGVFITKITVADGIEELVRQYYNARFANLPVRQQETALSNFQRGLCEGIAVLGLVLRSESYLHLNHIEPIFEMDIRVMLLKRYEEYQHATPDEKKQIIEDAVTELGNFILTDMMAALNESERQRKVLDGEVPALATDAEWITEKAEAKRREVEELLTLLQPVTEAGRSHVDD